MGFGDLAGAAWDATGGKVVDAAEDAWDGATGLAEDAYDWGAGAVDAAYDWGADLGEDVYDFGSSATGDIWGTALSTIDYVEDISPDVPWVDIEAEGGQLGLSVDIEGVGAGIDIGSHGVEGSADMGYLGQAELGLTDEGYSLGLAVGDTGLPAFVPALDFGVRGDYDGNVDAELEAQGSIPIGPGVLVGEVGGEFHRNEDGEWMAGGHAQADVYLDSGTRFGGNVAGSYAETEEGSFTQVSAGGYVSGSGFSARGDVNYVHADLGDEEFTSFDASGSFRGYGVSAAGSASYREFENEHGSVSGWETDLDVAISQDALEAAAGYLGDELGIEVPEGVTDVQGLVEGVGGDSDLVRDVLQRVTSGGVDEIGDQIVGLAGQASNMADEATDDLLGLLDDEVSEAASAYADQAIDAIGVPDELGSYVQTGQDSIDEVTGHVQEIAGQQIEDVQDVLGDQLSEIETSATSAVDEVQAAVADYAGDAGETAADALDSGPTGGDELSDSLDDLIDDL